VKIWIFKAKGGQFELCPSNRFTATRLSVIRCSKRTIFWRDSSLKLIYSITT